MIVELFPPSFNMKRATMRCSNRSSGVYSLNQGHMTSLPVWLNNLFSPPPPPPSSPSPFTTSGFSTPLVIGSNKPEAH